jgi:hypothetical protein
VLTVVLITLGTSKKKSHDLTVPHIALQLGCHSHFFLSFSFTGFAWISTFYAFFKKLFGLLKNVHSSAFKM